MHTNVMQLSDDIIICEHFYLNIAFLWTRHLWTFLLQYRISVDTSSIIYGHFYFNIAFLWLHHHSWTFLLQYCIYIIPLIIKKKKLKKKLSFSFNFQCGASDITDM